jgi:hypothetical protein
MALPFVLVYFTCWYLFVSICSPVLGFHYIYAWNFLSHQYRIKEVGARWLIAVAIVRKCVYGNHADETA